jgi:hypothetical protein
MASRRVCLDGVAQNASTTYDCVASSAVTSSQKVVPHNAHNRRVTGLPEVPSFKKFETDALGALGQLSEHKAPRSCGQDSSHRNCSCTFKNYTRNSSLRAGDQLQAVLRRAARLQHSQSSLMSSSSSSSSSAAHRAFCSAELAAGADSQQIQARSATIHFNDAEALTLPSCGRSGARVPRPTVATNQAVRGRDWCNAGRVRRAEVDAV